MATRKVRLGMVQMSMGEDRASNVRKATWFVREAASQGADIVCLPELFTSLYFPTSRSSRQAAEPVPGPTSRALSDAAKESKVVLVGGSVYEQDGGSRYNTCLVFGQSGAQLSKYRKVHIPQDERPGGSVAEPRRQRGWAPAAAWLAPAAAWLAPAAAWLAPAA
ncbi:MAG: hypothetical protein JRN08_08535, partial [Nitrososphaerota archaeon]|nr:hypothetical protein [Nitrososphaerota archaeon]